MNKAASMILGLFLGILLFGQCTAAEDAPDCEIDRGLCAKTVRETTVFLDISPKPVKAMQELTFIVLLRGGNDHGEATIDLSMPGMYMGKNRVILKRESPGKYTGKGIIPLCASGKRLWKATVTVAGVGTADFLFNVTH